MKKLINEQRRLIINSLKSLITTDYALLDIPNHKNIGDNLIWAGELEFLSNYISHKCVYSANVWNYQDYKLEGVDTILFHGGGNWGDLYRECQEFRLNLCKKFPNKRIIVFPQTVYYLNDTLLYSDNSILNQHPDLHVCARDQASYDILKNNGAKYDILLLPDMAFFLDFPQSNIITKKDLLLSRVDQEAIFGLTVNSNTNIDIKDWPTFTNNVLLHRIISKFLDFTNSFSVFLQKYKLTSFLVDSEYGLNNRQNRQRYIKIGVDFLNQYDKIYTTRLHGLILGVLLQKEIYILDNKYNKCINYYNTWLKEFNNIHLVSK